jgi:pimeloyl-ACP methyl ester carboxylesterase
MTKLAIETITRFRALIAHAVDEIRLRDEDYLRRFPVAIASPASIAHRHFGSGAFQQYSESELESALASALGSLSDSGLTGPEIDDHEDPVSDMIARSAVDAFAGNGGLALKPYTAPRMVLSEVLKAGYEERLTSGGTRYFLSSHGERPLLLINAVGVPLKLWSRLIGDRSHSYRILMVEGGSGDLISGGIERQADLSDDARDIAEVVDHAGLEQFDVLAWCDGAKVAIALTEFCTKIRSLALLSPSLLGIQGVEPRLSPFEDNMLRIFATIGAKPRLADLLAGTLKQQARLPDWDEFLDDPSARAATLFRLPARCNAEALLAPMSRGDYLINYGKRVAEDSRYPLHRGLQKLQMAVLLITGDQDNMVENAFTRIALQRWGHGAIHASVKGASHYVHDLQYIYFRALLEQFHGFGGPPGSLARVQIEAL